MSEYSQAIGETLISSRCRDHRGVMEEDIAPETVAVPLVQANPGLMEGLGLRQRRLQPTHPYAAAAREAKETTAIHHNTTLGTRRVVKPALQVGECLAAIARDDDGVPVRGKSRRADLCADLF